MKFSSTITACALAAACLLSSTNAHAIKLQLKTLSTPKMIVLTGLLANGYLLFQRKVEKDFQPRYSAQKLINIKKIFTKEYFENLWYLYYDGFIGQAGKTNETAYGVLGRTAYYLYPLKKAGGTLAFGYGLWCVGTDIEKHIVKLSRHKEDRPRTTEDESVETAV